MKANNDNEGTKKKIEQELRKKQQELFSELQEIKSMFSNIGTSGKRILRVLEVTIEQNLSALDKKIDQWVLKNSLLEIQELQEDQANILLSLKDLQAVIVWQVDVTLEQQQKTLNTLIVPSAELLYDPTDFKIKDKKPEKNVQKHYPGSFFPKTPEDDNTASKKEPDNTAPKKGLG